MYVCIYVYICICTYTHISTYTYIYPHIHTYTCISLVSRRSPQQRNKRHAASLKFQVRPVLFVCLRVCLLLRRSVRPCAVEGLFGRLRVCLLLFVCLFVFVGPPPPVARRPNGWLRGRVVLGVLTPGHFRPPPNGRLVCRSVCLQQILISKEVERARVRGLHAYVCVYRCRYRHMYIYAYISLFSFI